MKADSSMSGLELRELHNRLPHKVQIEVLPMEQVQEVWDWLDKE